MNNLHILRNYISQPVTPISLNLFKVYNNSKNVENLIKQSNFLKKELPVRLSHRVSNLIKLPYGLIGIPEIKGISELYIESFEKIVNYGNINTENDVIDFTNLLENIKENHSGLELTMATGIKKIENYDLIDLNVLNNELDNFFLSRISIRTLINQQINIVENGNGLIKTFNIIDMIYNSISDINYVSNKIYYDEPVVHFNENQEINISYIPEHISYILKEILKNAYIASYKNNCALQNNEKFTDINITVSEGSEFIIIKISDMGDSFSRSKLKQIFSYSFSTYPINSIPEEYEIANIPIIGGFGFGLPMSRLYCKYFNGDLVVCPMENSGTDVYIYINKLGNNKELLKI